MARPLRVEFPGAFYHVTNRGNAGEAIFRTNRDREKFLEYLGKAVERFGIKVHTYCLMTNHYHFLIETPEANLSRAIQWLNVSYAAYFNRKRQRRGHLFQGRFKSILVDADAYLKHLSRYIHLNPLRANMVEELVSHPWSSYPAFVGKAKAPDWLERHWLLSLFGKDRKQAFKAYRGFVEEVEPAIVENPAKDVIGGFILGSAEFVNWVKDTYLSKRPDETEIPQLKEVKPRPTPDAVVAAVCEEFGCDAEWIVQKGRKRNTARDVAIYLSRELTGASGAQLGKYFGDISGAGITVRYNHVVKDVSHNRRLKGRTNRIKKRIIKMRPCPPTVPPATSAVAGQFRIMRGNNKGIHQSTRMRVAMQKEEDHYRELDKKLAAVCGLYCEACSWFIATNEDHERLKRLAAQLHFSEEESKCYGCRSDKRLPYCEKCRMSACAAERGIDFCSECEEYPCDELKRFQSEMPHRIELWVNLERIKSVGYKQWLKEIRGNYTCPQCQIINSTYDLKCRKCGQDPSCNYVAKHSQVIEQYMMNR